MWHPSKCPVLGVKGDSGLSVVTLVLKMEYMNSMLHVYPVTPIST